MTTLQDVRDALQQNPDIMFIEGPDQGRLPDKYIPGGVEPARFIMFDVAPIKESLSAKALQDLMMRLVPGGASEVEDFQALPDGRLRLGQMFFNENLGTTRYVHRMNEGIVLPAGWTNRELELWGTIRAVTIIRVFPSIRIMGLVRGGTLNWGDIKPEDLEFYAENAEQPKLIGRRPRLLRRS